MALSAQQIRAIAIKRSIARKAETIAPRRPANQRTAKRARGTMLQACVDAAGFDQNAAYGC